MTGTHPTIGRGTRRALLALVLGVGLLTFATSTQAAPFQDGSFEQWTGGHNVDITGTVGAWTVQPGGTVEIDTSTDWRPVDGKQSLSLDGISPGAVCQSFDTVPGKFYSFSYFMSRNPNAASESMTVTVTSGSTTVTTDETHDAAWTHDDPGWQRHFIAFTAANTTSQLCFASDDTGANDSLGAAIDDVTLDSQGAVQSVPVVNGSFESPAVTGFTSESSLPGWTVSPTSNNTNGTVELDPTSTWTAQAGNQSMSLDGFNPAQACQSFNTTPGDLYSASYYMSRNGSAIGEMTVTVTSGSSTVKTVEIHNAPWSSTAPAWQQRFIDFTAQDSVSTLCFASDDPAGDSLGAAVDDVTLQQSTMAPPSCQITSPIGPSSEVVTVTAPAGLVGQPNGFKPLVADNATVSYPTYSAGATSIALTATKSDTTRGSVWWFIANDLAGNSKVCS